MIERMRAVLRNEPIMQQRLYPEGTDVSKNNSSTAHFDINWFFEESVENDLWECARNLMDALHRMIMALQVAK